MTKSSAVRVPPLGRRVAEYIVAGLDDFLKDLAAAAVVIAHGVRELPPDVKANADALLGGKGGLSYRDGVLIQLGWGLVAPEGYDHTKRGEGARTVGQALGRANAARHIPKVNDAYENIGKNQENLVRGNVPEWDELLPWMNRATEQQREQLFRYAAAKIASTARPVLPMPALRPVELTFGRVSALLEDLLLRPSGGAHEQFAVAAFLGALIDQFGLGGVGALSVRTKNINASDLSSGTAADVQILRGGMIEEVIEVSANGWRLKLDQAVQAARKAGLSRAHVVAHGDDTDDIVQLLSGSTVDVSVADVRAYLRMICSVLRPPAREDALRRLYDYIDNLQSDIALGSELINVQAGFTA
jgi:3-deoxy-D-manno-octulosonate 8-phosphate phosphatase KdsC-like HAD superfamily phosphatase